MLLKMMENGEQIDEVIFFDTGMEFFSIYSIMKQIQTVLEAQHIKFTRLKANKDFLYLMLEHQVKHRDGSQSCGYKWCGGQCRWYTSQKQITISKYLKERYPDGVIQCIGIASDEQIRILRNSEKRMPLVEYGMTERDCLDYCHSKGYFWMEGESELYDHLDRVSCWCCRNKNLKELREIYSHFKVYWFALCELESRCGMNMKSKSLRELESEFKKEKIENLKLF